MGVNTPLEKEEIVPKWMSINSFALIRYSLLTNRSPIRSSYCSFREVIRGAGFFPSAYSWQMATSELVVPATADSTTICRSSWLMSEIRFRIRSRRTPDVPPNFRTFMQYLISYNPQRKHYVRNKIPVTADFPPKSGDSRWLRLTGKGIDQIQRLVVHRRLVPKYHAVFIQGNNVEPVTYVIVHGFPRLVQSLELELLLARFGLV